MESGAPSGSLAEPAPETVNCCMPESDGPTRACTVSATDESETDDGLATISRRHLRALVLATDVVAEHRKAIISETPALVGIDTLDILSEAGLIDPDTLDVTDALAEALVAGARALALPHGREAASGGGAQASRALGPRGAPLARDNGIDSDDDGEGIDQLADNDDFEGDVTAAEEGFTAPLPAAGTFAGD